MESICQGQGDAGSTDIRDLMIVKGVTREDRLGRQYRKGSHYEKRFDIHLQTLPESTCVMDDDITLTFRPTVFCLGKTLSRDG